MRKERPLYIIGKKHHWCVDLAGKSINADYFLIPSLSFIKNSKFRNLLLLVIAPIYFLFLPKREIYLVSNIQDLLILKLRRIFFKNFITIHVVFSDYYNDSHKGVKRKFMNYLSKIVDGAIVPGNMLKEEIETQGFKFPVEVSYHYPKDDTFFKLQSNYLSRNVINIGIKSSGRKGENIFFKIAQNIPSSEFYLLGDKKHITHSLKEKMNNLNNFHLTGYTHPPSYIPKCIFFLLPGKYDAGPIALNEAMAAGLIPLVSHNIGGQDLVKELREDLVINTLDFQNYIDKLRELMKLTDSELEKLSKRAKKVALKWTKEKGMIHFRKKYNELLTKI